MSVQASTYYVSKVHVGTYLIAIVMVTSWAQSWNQNDKDHQGNNDTSEPRSQGPRLMPWIWLGSHWVRKLEFQVWIAHGIVQVFQKTNDEVISRNDDKRFGEAFDDGSGEPLHDDLQINFYDSASLLSQNWVTFSVTNFEWVFMVTKIWISPDIVTNSLILAKSQS